MNFAHRTYFARRSVPLSYWPALAVALLLGFLPFDAPAEPTSEELRQEWLNIQTADNRRARAAWWRDLDYERMRHFISARVLLDVEDRRGWTPLHSAARFNPDSRILVALLDGGADVNAKDSAGDTPLHWAAAENSNVQVVRELISAGADVNACDRYGWSPLHTAAERSANPNVIRELLGAGAKRNKRAYFVLFGPKFLLRHNANLSREDKVVLREELDRPEPETIASR